MQKQNWFLQFFYFLKTRCISRLLYVYRINKYKILQETCFLLASWKALKNSRIRIPQSLSRDPRIRICIDNSQIRNTASAVCTTILYEDTSRLTPIPLQNFLVSYCRYRLL
jgi:hypothetical protein